MSRAVPAGYRELLPVWNRLAVRLHTTYIALGATATVSSLVAASFTVELGVVGVKVCSFIAAVSLALLTAFDVGGKGNGARSAWRLLNSAVLAYENNPQFSIERLHADYIAGENLLGDVKYSSPTAKPAAPLPTH